MKNMIEEIFTQDDEKNEQFDVGVFLGKHDNFRLYEMTDERGRLLSISVINDEAITKIVKKDDYLDYIEFYKNSLEKVNAYDPLKLRQNFDVERFNFSKLKGQLVNTLYGDEEFWDLSEVIEVNDKTITLKAVETPLFSTVNGIEKDLPLENFVTIEILSVELELLSKKLGYRTYGK